MTINAKPCCPKCQSEKLKKHDPRKMQCLECATIGLNMEFEAAGVVKSNGGPAPGTVTDDKTLGNDPVD
jgi:ribosomal protein L37AE/L43A